MPLLLLDYSLRSLAILSHSQDPHDPDLTHYIDLNGDQSLFLQANYSYTPSLSNTPKIDGIQFMFCPLEGDQITVESPWTPVSLDAPTAWNPVSQPSLSYQGRYDLTTLLHSSPDSGKALVLCVRYLTDLLNDFPIQTLDIVKAEKLYHNQRFSYQLNIDRDATMVHFALGSQKNRFLVIKKRSLTYL